MWDQYATPISLITMCSTQHYGRPSAIIWPLIWVNSWGRSTCNYCSSMKTMMAGGSADAWWQENKVTCSTIVMAQHTGSWGMILCNSLQVPDCSGARLLGCETEMVEGSSGLSIWTAPSAQSIRNRSWVEIQQAMDLGHWSTTHMLHTWPHPQWLFTCYWNDHMLQYWVVL